MTEDTDQSAGTTQEPESYSPEDVKKIVAEAQQRQKNFDDMRAYGNAFFAESIDHIRGLAARDPFWRTVLSYGEMFKDQFEGNTLQKQPEPAPEPEKPPGEDKPEKKRR